MPKFSGYICTQKNFLLNLCPAVGPDSFGVQRYSYVFPDTKKPVLFQYTVCYLELRQGKLHNLTLSTLSLIPVVAHGNRGGTLCFQRWEGGRTSAPEVQEVPRRCVGFTKRAQSLGVGLLCSLQRSLKTLAALFFTSVLVSVCLYCDLSLCPDAAHKKAHNQLGIWEVTGQQSGVEEAVTGKSKRRCSRQQFSMNSLSCPQIAELSACFSDLFLS